MQRWRLGGLVSVITLIMGCTQPITNDDTVTIYFARHGKTVLNSMDRVQGLIDSPLTKEGQTITVQLGEGLKGIPFDAFYTSDAGRQRETMQILLKQMNIVAPTIEDARLREVNFGSFEGGFNKDMAQASAKQLGLKDGAELFQQMRSGKLDAAITLDSIALADPEKLAETADQVKQRTQAALHDMVKTALANGQKNILAVSSGSSMQMMIADLTTDPDKNKPLSNATVVKIIYHNGQYQVAEIGTKAYIEKGKAVLGIK